MHLTANLRPIMYGIVLPGPNVSEGVPIVKGGDVAPGRLHVELLDRTTFGIEAGYARSRLLVNDLVFAIRGSIGSVELVPEELWGANITQDVARIAPAAGVSPRWLLYALRSDVVFAHVESRSTGATIRGINIRDLKRIPIPTPRLEVQTTIADFLDRKTSEIGSLIETKERLIELLEKKRSALITRAVTRGLDPSAPMKDSGILWLGAIPAHWDVKRTKFAARLRSGHTPSRQHSEYWVDCDVPWFSLADVWRLREDSVEYVRETSEKISALGLANSAARLLPAGTVLLSRTASVGFSAIAEVPMATTQDFVNWVCGQKLRSEFLLYVFRSMRPEFERLVMGSTHQTIYMPDVGRFVCPIPPLEEQDRIVTFIRSETERIKRLSEKIVEAVDRLREYRTALISAAVTGRIDVKEFGDLGLDACPSR